MSHNRAPLEQDIIAPHWSDPFAMLIAMLARIFQQIVQLKRVRRTTRFKANWRDHWAGLRQSEWHRDQLLAAGAAELLAGKDLTLEHYDLIMDPPDDYGGPCPVTPYEMNRRFLALARWNADPEAAIRKHAKRIAKRAGTTLGGCPLRLASRSTSPMLRMEEETRPVFSSLSRFATGGGGMHASCVHDGGGSHSSRGPPPILQNQKTHLAPTCENAPACPRHRTGLSTNPMTTRANLIRLMKRATQLAPARRS